MIVILYGPRASGKTRFARVLLNAMRGDHSRIVVIDPFDHLHHPFEDARGLLLYSGFVVLTSLYDPREWASSDVSPLRADLLDTIVSQAQIFELNHRENVKTLADPIDGAFARMACVRCGWADRG